MSSDLGQFLEACGANGPLRLEWDDWETGRINLEKGISLTSTVCEGSEPRQHARKRLMQAA